MGSSAKLPFKFNPGSTTLETSTEGWLAESRGDGFLEEGPLEVLDSFKPEEPGIETG